MNFNTNEILLGNHAFGKAHKVFTKDDVRKMHCHIIGGSGTGKSKLMEYMIRQDIRNGKGVCVIDPHGSLYDNTLKWIIENGLTHRLVLIDPTDEKTSIGLNMLKYNEDELDIGKHIENVIDSIGKALNEDIFSTAQISIWLRYFLQLGAYHNLTINDIGYLIESKNSELRDVLTSQINDNELRWQMESAWNKYDNASKNAKTEIMEMPVWSRIVRLLTTKKMRQISGQVESKIDFYEAMNKGKVILVNLHGKISVNERNLLGIMIIDKIYNAATKRKADRGKQFFVYIDEFAYFVSEQIASALEELRKRNVSFILAHQELEQVRLENSDSGQRLLASIMTNTKVKIAFRISRSDAELMALEMFGGFINGDEIKHEQRTTSFWPKETTRESKGISRSWSDADTNSIMDSVGKISAQMSGQVLIPGVGFMPSQLATESLMASDGTSSSSGSSRGKMKGYSESEVMMEFPFYELDPFEQVVSTTFYSVDEIKERFFQFLQNQADRYFHLKIMGETNRPPIALKTPDVREVRILPSKIKAVCKKNAEKYATPTEDIEKEVKKRREYLLNIQNESVDSDDDFTGKFNPKDYE